MSEPEYIEIRCSSIPSYGDCPRRAAARLFKGKLEADGFFVNPSRPSVGAGIGTAIHKGIANLMRSKQALGEFVSSEVERAATDAYESFLEETKDGVIWDKTTPHGATAKAQIEALLYSFVPTLEQITPSHIEVPLEAIISPLGEQAAFKIKVTGTLDIRDTSKVIWDWKTGGSMPAPQAQGGGYVCLTRLNDIGGADAFRMAYSKRAGIRATSAGLPPPIVRSYDAEECLSAFWSQCSELQRHYEAYAESSEKGAPEPWCFPANPMSRLCTPNYCNVLGTPFCTMGVNKDDEE